MLSLIQKDNLKLYLASSEVVNYNDIEIQEKARELSINRDEIQSMENIYNFVRDEILHSMDVGRDEVTIRASEVLEEGHGLCFAKSNLLAAFLRFIGIPTGFCYQRLVHEEGFIVHGLNAAYLNGKWVRMDARGNHDEVNAQFFMDREQLAFYPHDAGEEDYPYVFSQPDFRVIKVMRDSRNVDEVMDRIPTSIEI